MNSVREITHAAFTAYGEARYYVPALQQLQNLKGVSFTIATLILAEYDPENIPYMVDGVCRWLREDEARDGSWDRKVDHIVSNSLEFQGGITF